MEFHEKLQTLRKRKGMTQEELAASLFVSRTAVSKWESGRGYPSIDSLKALSSFFSVSLDELLSNEEILTLAEEDYRHKEKRNRNVIFCLLDCSAVLYFFLPFFGQSRAETIYAVPLTALTEIPPYLKLAYFAVVIAMSVLGMISLALQSMEHRFHLKDSNIPSWLFNIIGILLFIIGRQPYAALYAFALLIIKAVFYRKTA